MGPQSKGLGIQVSLRGLNPRAKVFSPFYGASIPGPRYSVLFVGPQSQGPGIQAFLWGLNPRAHRYSGLCVGPKSQAPSIQASVWGLNPRALFRPFCGALIHGPRYSGLFGASIPGPYSVGRVDFASCFSNFIQLQAV